MAEQTREDMIRQFLEEERAATDAQQAAFVAPVGDPEDAAAEAGDEPVLALPSGEDDMGTDAYYDTGGFGMPDEDGVLIAWEGPEYETYQRDRQWYIVAAVLLLLIVAYAVIVNSPIMAITFILIGLVGYIYLQRDPQEIVFAVTREGVYAGRQLYSYAEIESFWVFYEPPHTYLLTLTLKSRLVPHVHLPLHQVDPVALRAALMEFIPERRKEMDLVDTIERLLHI